VFNGGKLQSWTLTRPEAAPDDAPSSEEDKAG